MSKKVPVWFARAISQMDPLLSVRESVSTLSHFVIERKGIVTPSEIETTRRRRDRLWRWIHFPNENQKAQLHQNRVTWQSLADEVEALEHGKRVICRPRELSQKVFNDLCQSDLQRYGGAARYCTDLEQAEERHDAEIERILSNQRSAFNSEVYDIMSFLDRRRTDAMCNKPESELDLRHLLHGTHSKPGDAPVIQLSDF